MDGLSLHEIIRIIESRLSGGYGIASDAAIKKAEEYVVKNPNAEISLAYRKSLARMGLKGKAQSDYLGAAGIDYLNTEELRKAKGQ